MIKFKKTFFIFLIFSLSYLNINAQSSSDQESFLIDYPYNTEFIEKKNVDSELRTMMLYRFRSQLSKEEIVAFYRNLFIGQGFKEEKGDYGQENSIFDFHKGYIETATVNVYHRSEEGLTYYFVTMDEMRYVLALGYLKLEQPEDPGFMPVYSKSKQFQGSFMGGVPKQKAGTYLASGRVKDLIDFYKERMPEFGWSLTGSQQRKGRYNVFAAMSTGFAEHQHSPVSSNPKESFPGANVTVEGATLTFAQQGKHCVININQFKDPPETLKKNKIADPSYLEKYGDILINVLYTEE